MRSLAETSNFRSAAPTLLTTSKPIWNYELWVKLWLIGLVIPVYTLFIPWQRSMCSSLVFSFCVTEISPLTGSAYSPPQKSPEGQNVSASFLLHLHPALFLLFFFFCVCLLLVSHMLNVQIPGVILFRCLFLYNTRQRFVTFCFVVNPPACALKNPVW